MIGVASNPPGRMLNSGSAFSPASHRHATARLLTFPRVICVAAEYFSWAWVPPQYGQSIDDGRSPWAASKAVEPRKTRQTKRFMRSLHPSCRVFAAVLFSVDHFLSRSAATSSRLRAYTIVYLRGFSGASAPSGSG